jgi:general secretion pathway protein H
MARTRTSAPGSSRSGQRPGAAAAKRGRGSAGFTLVELLIVVALIALASGIASLALRDPATAQLEQEAVRLSALLEAARAEARAAGVPVRWQLTEPDASTGAQGARGFRFVGLQGDASRPMGWLHEGVSAQVVGAAAVQLGPEPIIAAQRIVLSLDDRQVVLATDGLAPFRIADAAPAQP